MSPVCKSQQDEDKETKTQRQKYTKTQRHKDATTQRYKDKNIKTKIQRQRYKDKDIKIKTQRQNLCEKLTIAVFRNALLLIIPLLMTGTRVR